MESKIAFLRKNEKPGILIMQERYKENKTFWFMKD